MGVPVPEMIANYWNKEGSLYLIYLTGHDPFVQASINQSIIFHVLKDEEYKELITKGSLQTSDKKKIVPTDILSVKYCRAEEVSKLEWERAVNVSRKIAVKTWRKGQLLTVYKLKPINPNLKELNKLVLSEKK